MVKRRIKDRWHNSTPEDINRDVTHEKTLSEQASALAYIIWRQSLNAAINLHAEDFRYDDDQERIAVISEFVAFQVQHVDRLFHVFSEQADRQALLVGICEKLSDQIQDNLVEIDGPRNYRAPFISMLNSRFSQYALLGYNGKEPSFECLRFLGHNVLVVLGEDQVNRWVIDHIIAIEAPDLVAQLTRSLTRLFDQKVSN